MNVEARKPLWAPATASAQTAPIRASLNFTVAATTRCVAGKVVLTVQATNGASEPVDLSVTTGFGTKTFLAIASTKSAAAAFTTREMSVLAGSVTVTGAGTPEGWRMTESVVADYQALRCG